MARKGLLIGSVLIVLCQFNGCNTMLNYTADIFRESGSNVSPNVAAIIIGFIQLLGAYAATELVDRSGRKVYQKINNILLITDTHIVNSFFLWHQLLEQLLD